MMMMTMKMSLTLLLILKNNNIIIGIACILNITDDPSRCVIVTALRCLSASYYQVCNALKGSRESV